MQSSFTQYTVCWSEVYGSDTDTRKGGTFKVEADTYTRAARKARKAARKLGGYVISMTKGG